MDQFNRREDRLNALIGELSLREFAWNNEPWPDSIELGLLQLDSRSIRLQGAVLEKFACAWAKEFLIGGDPLLGPEIDEHFEVAFSEKAASLTRFVIRKHLKGEAPLSLKQLAAHVYDPKKEGFRTSANRLIKEFQDAMHFTKLWDIEVVERTVQGKTAIGGYKISAGQLLVDWEAHVWRPLRQEQLRQFYEKYGDAL
ncbi:hypothetical protein KBY31_21645 [Ruegeria pomeroyi]|nr:hypothetical protein [Ruegeria pomeroyi]